MSNIEKKKHDTVVIAKKICFKFDFISFINLQNETLKSQKAQHNMITNNVSSVLKLIQYDNTFQHNVSPLSQQFIMKMKVLQTFQLVIWLAVN